MLIAPWGQPYGIVDDVLAEMKLSRRVALTVPYFNAAPKLVERSNLISTVPIRMAETWQRDYNIAVLKPPVAIPKFSLYMLWAERSQKNPPHEWLREELRVAARKAFS